MGTLVVKELNKADIERFKALFKRALNKEGQLNNENMQKRNF